jgi:hypothetical protein
MEDVFVIETGPRVSEVVCAGLGIIFAASCVWLTVRIVNRRKKRGMPFWATVVVAAVLVAYPLSLGPACWITSRTNVGAAVVGRVYHPIMALTSRWRPAFGLAFDYSTLFAGKEWRWFWGHDDGSFIWGPDGGY